MTDLTPNDLSHLSDEEFNALCPQGEHAPGPEPLSPAAQAVLDAAAKAMECPDGFLPYELELMAAALRAAAACLPRSAMYPDSDWGYAWRTGVKDAERELLAIATELENHQ